MSCHRSNVSPPHRRRNPTEPLIETRGLHVTFGRQEVLRDIDLAIPRGQTLAIIGESGCGKTVLLKTIIGLLRPTRGQVLFDGQDLAQLREQELTRAADPLRLPVPAGRPVRQHDDRPERGLSRCGSTPASDARRSDEIVWPGWPRWACPSGVLRKKPAELSGGMRKRVGLARALALDRK